MPARPARVNSLFRQWLPTVLHAVERVVSADRDASRGKWKLVKCRFKALAWR
jgi:hypothetical protein